MSEPQMHSECTPKKTRAKKETQDAFLAAFAEHGIVQRAARDTGVSRRVVYQWLEKDEQFNFAFNQAKEEVRDTVRAEIYRRAVEGWDENVYQLGQFAGTVRKYSDTLLIFHAKALMPEYREHQHIEHSGSIDIAGAKEQLLDKLSRLSENSEASK